MTIIEIVLASFWLVMAVFWARLHASVLAARITNTELSTALAETRTFYEQRLETRDALNARYFTEITRLHDQLLAAKLSNTTGDPTMLARSVASRMQRQTADEVLADAKRLTDALNRKQVRVATPPATSLEDPTSGSSVR